MNEIMYNPEEVGKEVMNSHGRRSKIRKYHMTIEDIDRTRKKWLSDIDNIDKRVVKRAGDKFFNPYRKGIYYYQIQAMFLLGANEWHSLSSIVNRMEKVMSPIMVKRDGILINTWDKFRGKRSRKDAIKCKDHIGRIQENMVFFQRLSRFHPYGYKLRQVCSAVDIKRVSRSGFPNGCYYYRLSTYDSVEKSLPIRDYSKFEFPLHESKYISSKFIGTIISKGELNEVS